MTLKIILGLFLASISFHSFAASTLIGKPAPTFELKNQAGQIVKLADRKGKGFTVLFFYPKAGTPGCTKQVCAFRDSIKSIKNLGAEVYGISTDSVVSQKKFFDEHKLSFDLLSDESGSVTSSYHTKMPLVTMSKRQTFILDSDLKIVEHFEDVDPSLDPKKVSDAITALTKK